MLPMDFGFKGQGHSDCDIAAIGGHVLFYKLTLVTVVFDLEDNFFEKKRKCWLPAFPTFPTLSPKVSLSRLLKRRLYCKRLTISRP